MKNLINARDLRKALRFYLFGLLIMIPVAISVSNTLGTQALFRITGPVTIAATCVLLSVDLLKQFAFLRRAADVIVSLTLLLLYAPLLLLIGVAIKIDDPSGPVLFRRRVVGERGKVFSQYKFRTMHIESLLREEKHLRFAWKVADDPRVTLVGRILRRFSLDELPQFFNILRGDMTLIGPPPRVAALVARRVIPAPDKMPGLFPDSFDLFWMLTAKAREVYTAEVQFEKYELILRDYSVQHSPNDIPPVLCHQG